MVRKAGCVVSLAAFFVSAAGAQEWSELQTLTFVPVRTELPLTVSGAAQDSESGERDSAPGAQSELQSSSQADRVARLQALTETIDAEQQASGENSPAVFPYLLQLAELHSETGDYADAMLVLEQAQQIVRRSQGLYSLEQADVIERMVEIQMELPREQRDPELEDQLRTLIRRNPGDPRNVNMLTNMAERQMDEVRDLLIDGLPPSFTLDIDGGIGPGRGGQFFGARPTTRAVASASLREARASYGMAMREAMVNSETGLPLLLELEGDIIDTFYFELMNPRLRRRGQPYAASNQLHFLGRRALQAQIANSGLYPGTPLAETNARLELADWDLLFLSFGRAMDEYQAAFEFLRSQNVGDELLSEVFSPQTPVPLPAFVSNPSVFSEVGNTRGYIDVEISINRFGGVRSFRVIGGSDNVSPSIERRLKRFVHQTRFRPRYVNGEWLRRDTFPIRYEFGYRIS